MDKVNGLSGGDKLTSTGTGEGYGGSIESLLDGKYGVVNIPDTGLYHPDNEKTPQGALYNRKTSSGKIVTIGNADAAEDYYNQNGISINSYSQWETQELFIHLGSVFDVTSEEARSMCIGTITPTPEMRNKLDLDNPIGTQYPTGELRHSNQQFYQLPIKVGNHLINISYDKDGDTVMLTDLFRGSNFRLCYFR